MDLETTAIKQIREKEEEWSDLWARMDNDYERWTVSGDVTYYRKSYDTHAGMINIILPDPRSYADELQKGLVRSDRTISIFMGELEGSDERDNISKLERLFEFCLERADNRLLRRGLLRLKSSVVWYGMLRGRMAARIVNWIDGKNGLVADYLPLDPRWLTYEYDADGLKWVNYKTFRTAEDLKNAYNFPVNKKVSAVNDYYLRQGDKIVNLLMTDKELIKKNIHKMSEIPIIITPISTRPPISDHGGARIVGFGDSIYADVRELIDIRNKIASLFASWVNLNANMPYKHFRGDSGTDIENLISYPGATWNLGPNEDIVPIEQKDISNVVLPFLGMLDAQWQRGSAPYVVFGDIEMPSSGTAISELKEAEEKAYFLCLEALDAFYTQLCYMTERQIVEGGLKFEIEGVKDKKLYSDKITPVDIKRPHVIKVTHTIRSKFGELQDYQIAQMAEMLGLSKETIYEKILKLQDPKREKELAAIEILEQHPLWMTHIGGDRSITEKRRDFYEFTRWLRNQMGAAQSQPVQLSATPQVNPRLRKTMPGEPTPVEASPVGTSPVGASPVEASPIEMSPTEEGLNANL